MENPFSIIDRRLNKIELLLLKINENKIDLTKPSKKPSQNNNRAINSNPKIKKEAANG